jgi:hypothetical protein
MNQVVSTFAGNEAVGLVVLLVLGGLLVWGFLRLRALHLTTKDAITQDLTKHAQQLASQLTTHTEGAKGVLASISATINAEVQRVESLFGKGTSGGGGSGGTATITLNNAPATPDQHAQAAAAAAAAAVQQAAAAAAAAAAAGLQQQAAAVGSATPARAPGGWNWAADGVHIVPDGFSPAAPVPEGWVLDAATGTYWQQPPK